MKKGKRPSRGWYPHPENPKFKAFWDGKHWMQYMYDTREPNVLLRFRNGKWERLVSPDGSRPPIPDPWYTAATVLGFFLGGWAVFALGRAVVGSEPQVQNGPWDLHLLDR